MIGEPTPNGKSPTRRAQNSRVAIIGAATEHFLERGFDRTTMDDVALAAGVSKQTVYAHFASKERPFS